MSTDSSPQPIQNTTSPSGPNAAAPQWHIHPHLGETVESIGGYYVLESEDTVWWNERQVLFARGFAELDTSCCGYTGTTYVVVAGYVAGNLHQPGPDGEPRTPVWRVRDPAEQEALRALLSARTGAEQVSFR